MKDLLYKGMIILVQSAWLRITILITLQEVIILFDLKTYKQLIQFQKQEKKQKNNSYSWCLSASNFWNACQVYAVDGISEI